MAAAKRSAPKWDLHESNADRQAGEPILWTSKLTGDGYDAFFGAATEALVYEEFVVYPTQVPWRVKLRLLSHQWKGYRLHLRAGHGSTEDLECLFTIGRVPLDIIAISPG